MEGTEATWDSTPLNSMSCRTFNLTEFLPDFALNTEQQTLPRKYSASSRTSQPDAWSCVNSDDHNIPESKSTGVSMVNREKPLSTTSQHFEMADYHASVLKLACAYQSVIRKYATIEQAALNYRTSADEVSQERQSSYPLPTREASHSPSNYGKMQNRFGATENLNLLQNESCSICYTLNSDLVGPSRTFLNQLTGISAANVLAHQQINGYARLSGKVFLGGVPMIERQVTAVIRDQLHRGLEIFGPVNIIWPKGTTVQSAPSFCYANSSRNEVRRGHCYATFNDPTSVALLLSACQRRNKGCYINFSSLCPELKLSHLESIQVIPWDRTDTEMHAQRGFMVNKSESPQTQHNSEFNPELSLRRKKQYSVFMGALHGMLTARALFHMCDELFGNVDSAVLDTDRYHYPIGSGRVAFTSPLSYLAAVSANFIHVNCQFFRKTIQIDPYLEDALCCKCVVSPGVYFCRDLKCFDYFCPACWIQSHPASTTHKPIRRTVNPKTNDMLRV